eukprot:6212798-Pleurochrysis_carterae.AAC.2
MRRLRLPRRRRHHRHFIDRRRLIAELLQQDEDDVRVPLPARKPQCIDAVQVAALQTSACGKELLHHAIVAARCRCNERYCQAADEVDAHALAMAVPQSLARGLSKHVVTSAEDHVHSHVSTVPRSYDQRLFEVLLLSRKGL